MIFTYLFKFNLLFSKIIVQSVESKAIICMQYARNLKSILKEINPNN